MVERGKCSEKIADPESILTSEIVESLLESGKETLLLDGHLAPTLFLHLEHGEKLATDLSLPCIQEEKQAYFKFQGKSIRYSGHALKEAILLAETWFVMADKQDELTIPPSQHPNRQEAITLTGRNAQNNRSVFAIRPFRRDDHNKPIFGELVLNQFDGMPDPNYYATGLLDHLFVPGNNTS